MLKAKKEVKKSRRQLLSFSIFQWFWIEYIIIQDGWCPLSIHIPLSGRPSPISFPVLRPHDPIANDEPSPMPSPNAHDNHGHNDSCQYYNMVYIYIYINDIESRYHGKRWRMIDISRCTAILEHPRSVHAVIFITARPASRCTVMECSYCHLFWHGKNPAIWSVTT